MDSDIPVIIHRQADVSPYVAEAAAKIDLKLCRDCQFYRANDGKCVNPNSLLMDYVNGDHRFYAAHLQRVDANACAPEARWFESANAREKAEAEHYGDRPGDDE